MILNTIVNRIDDAGSVSALTKTVNGLDAIYSLNTIWSRTLETIKKLFPKI